MQNNSYLDSTGLSILVKHIKRSISDTVEQEVLDTFGDDIKKLDNIIYENQNYYFIKDNDVYPLSHPDLSTQPSILPQRFGNLNIHEVLIANGREYEIPKDATVIEASSFNGTACVPAIVKKNNAGQWSISNHENITPDFTLIRYIGADKGYYGYGYSEEKEDGEDHLLCTIDYGGYPENVDIYGKGSTLTRSHVEEYLQNDSNKTVIVYGSVKTIASGTFAGGKVYQVDIKDGVEYIENDAFFHNYITSITLPSSIKGLGYGCFNQNIPTQNVYIHATTPPFIDNDVFGSSDSLKIYVPAASIQDYQSSYQWRDYVSNLHILGQPISGD